MWLSLVQNCEATVNPSPSGFVCSSHTAPISYRQNHFKKQLQKTVESALNFNKLRKFYALNQTHPAQTASIFPIFVYKFSASSKTVPSCQNFSQVRKICVIC